MVATFSACWLWSVPAPTTAAVVSMLPPIQAPATFGDRFSQMAAAGWRNMSGRANRITSPVT